MINTPGKIKRSAYKTVVLLLTIAFFSCTQQEKKEVLLNPLTRSDFENSLSVDGVVEAVRSTNYSCPYDTEGEIIYLIEDGTMVNEGDIVCILENRQVQNEYEQLLIEVETSKASLNKSIADMNMQYALLDAQVKNNAAQTAIANLDSLQLKFASPVQRRIKELELQKAAIEKTKLEKKLLALESINKSQIRRQELQIQRREVRAANTKDRLDKLTLKATQSGMVQRAVSWLTGNKVQEGDQVWGNMPIITIPDLSEMKVKIMASEATYKRININDSIEYSFDAMPGNSARGKILTKAPVGQPVKEKSKVKFFEVVASVDSFLTLPKPGLTVSCKVIIARIPDTLVVPQLAIFEEDSIKVVYVKDPSDGYERRQVKIGASSPKSAVITAGLRESEILSLIKPSSSHIKSNKLLPNSLKKKSKSKVPNKITPKKLKTKPAYPKL